MAVFGCFSSFLQCLQGFVRREKVYIFKRSFIAIFSMLFVMLVFAYAFRPILF